MTTDVALVDVPLTDANALGQALTAYSDARAVLIRWIASELVGGVDYMVIHRRKDCRNGNDPKTSPCPSCKSKATLLQPGAQKICALLKVVPVFTVDKDTWDMLPQADKDAGTFCFTCQLHRDTADGPVIAEGRGVRCVAQDQGIPNTSVKMGQKSAMIDAAIRLGGLSDAYTQDVEDLRSDAPKVSAFGEPPRKVSGTPEPFHPLKAQHQVMGRLRTMASSHIDRNQRFEVLRTKLMEKIGQELSKESFSEMSESDYATVNGWLDDAQGMTKP